MFSAWVSSPSGPIDSPSTSSVPIGVTPSKEPAPLWASDHPSVSASSYTGDTWPSGPGDSILWLISSASRTGEESIATCCASCPEISTSWPCSLSLSLSNGSPSSSGRTRSSNPFGLFGAMVSSAAGVMVSCSMMMVPSAALAARASSKDPNTAGFKPAEREPVRRLWPRSLAACCLCFANRSPAPGPATRPRRFTLLGSGSGGISSTLSGGGEDEYPRLLLLSRLPPLWKRDPPPTWCCSSSSRFLMSPRSPLRRS
mmetsp:Transcript_44206/g.60372  ORF Transcript_44206/g.60372 Transcript_44206/m.60372 type:complete len:257 (-) Transcript_44206:541-1311(-)